ncbi:MAG: prepilin-type N-terminal cleavage/methylation domain-containing protein [Candidatus Hydrogenedentes bacterium]|nr:prepilin-type N-terminal cleavage/methylation domain-containing protein [Candidatus Hydrogenedentota bacterium]
MKSTGFTMLELIISLALLSIVSVLGFAVMAASVKVMGQAATQEVVDTDLRDVINAMRNELELASKTTNAALVPPLSAVAVTNNPVAGAPIEIAFQKPLNSTGNNWSTAIRYRFINEDANGNGRLDTSEDTDNNRVLTRRIVRIQDMNGNGSTADAGETTPVGGANDISNVAMALDASRSMLTITLTASRRLSNDPSRPPITGSVTTNIYLVN